jgi:hypothetical protein
MQSPHDRAESLLAPLGTPDPAAAERVALVIDQLGRVAAAAGEAYAAWACESQGGLAKAMQHLDVVLKEVESGI